MRIAEWARFWLYDHLDGTWIELQSLTQAVHTVTPNGETLELELISAWEIDGFRLSPDSYYGVVIVYPHGYLGEFLFTQPNDVEHYVKPDDPEGLHGLPRQRWHLIRASERDLESCPIPPAHHLPRAKPAGPMPTLVAIPT